MFTGIIQELGTVTRFDRAGKIWSLEIRSAAIPGETTVGDSVAVNGACLTVAEKRKSTLRFDVMAQTIRKTGLASLRAGDAVNLEGSLRANGALGGHFVLGHVDCAGTVKNIARSGDDVLMTIAFAPEFGPLVVEKGSVAIDGVSLTVGDVTNDALTVYLIPHTLKTTTLGAKKRGDRVNLEFDIIGKYVARAAKLSGGGRITEDFLRSRGF